MINLVHGEASSELHEPSHRDRFSTLKLAKDSDCVQAPAQMEKEGLYGLVLQSTKEKGLDETGSCDTIHECFRCGCGHVA